MQNYIDVLKKYAVFSGRARRKEYWMFVLFSAIASIIVSILDSILNTPKFGGDSGLISSLYSLAVLLPTIAVGVRRLHDTDRTGWWILTPIIPLPFLFIPGVMVFAIIAVFALGIALFCFTVFDSTPGDNKYGPNPKGIAATTTSEPAQTTQA